MPSMVIPDHNTCRDRCRHRSARIWRRPRPLRRRVPRFALSSWAWPRRDQFGIRRQHLHCLPRVPAPLGPKPPGRPHRRHEEGHAHRTQKRNDGGWTGTPGHARRSPSRKRPKRGRRWPLTSPAKNMPHRCPTGRRRRKRVRRRWSRTQAGPVTGGRGRNGPSPSCRGVVGASDATDGRTGCTMR